AIAIRVFLPEIFQRHELFVVDRHGLSRIPLRSARYCALSPCGRGQRGSNNKLVRVRGWRRGYICLLGENPSSGASRHLLPEGEKVLLRLGKREERQRGAVGRLEHHLDLLADLEPGKIAIDDVGL